MADPKTQALQQRILQRLWSMQPPNSEKQTEEKASSFARGAGANTGLPERAAGKLLDSTRDPKNTYVGSTGDTLEKGGKNASEKYPGANRIGAESVATPLAIAGAEALPAASLAGSALQNAGIGAAHGAYTAPEGADRTRSAALGAGAGALTPLAGAAASNLKSVIGNIPPPGAGGVPALAMAGESAEMRAATPQAAEGPQLNFAHGAAPPNGNLIPTIPPPAAAPKMQQLARAERDRLSMRPPAENPALVAEDPSVEDQLLAGGIPKAKVPLEYSGKYRVDHGPTDMMPPENKTQFAIREKEQSALQRQARGLEPGPGMPPAQRGQSLYDALLDESRAGQRQGLQTMPAEYARNAPSQGLTELDGMLGDLQLSETPTRAPNFMSMQPPSNVSGPPTVLPTSMPTYAPAGARAQAQLPGSSHAIDEMKLSAPNTRGELKDARLPAEYSGKYEPDFGPKDFEPAEEKNAFLSRVQDEKLKLKGAMGDDMKKTIKPPRKKKS